MGKSLTLENKDVRPGHLGRATPARSPPPEGPSLQGRLAAPFDLLAPLRSEPSASPPPQAPGSPNPHLTYFLECGCVLKVTFPT